MLPLSASTATEVILGGGLRQARAVRHARRRMLDAAAALRVAAGAVADSTPEAEIPVRTVLGAATTLERNAEAIEQPPDVLFELVATAYRRSEVPLRDSEAAARRRRDAQRGGQPPPAELRTPTYEQGERLRTARVRLPKDARVLHDLVVVLIEEAELHGTGPVFVAWRIERDRLVLRVADRKRPPRDGVRGSGAARLARLARQLSSAGKVDVRENVHGDFAGLNPRPGWFGVQVSCSVDVLAGFAAT
jgi:hypothetical protein